MDPRPFRSPACKLLIVSYGAGLTEKLNATRMLTSYQQKDGSYDV
jgi:hypothetical protein